MSGWRQRLPLYVHGAGLLVVALVIVFDGNESDAGAIVCAGFGVVALGIGYAFDRRISRRPPP